MSNPLVQLGTLNRLRGSITVASNASLNVTASYLNKDGIQIALEGDMTAMLPAMTGMVPSPEPYVPVTVTVHLLKTQPLSALYKSQLENSTLIGNITVRVDSAAHPPYDFTNCAIAGVDPIKISGEDAGWVIRIRGTYNINSTLFDT